MFCYTLLYVHSSIAIILMGKRELIALLNLSSWCLVMVERLFLVVPRGCLRFVIVVFPDHTHLLFLKISYCFNSLPLGNCSWFLSYADFFFSKSTFSTNNLLEGVSNSLNPDQARCKTIYL